MAGFLIFLLIAAVITAIVFGILTHAKHERQRIDALTQWAAAHGFSYSKNDPYDLESRFLGLADIGNGHSRYAFEVLYRANPIPIYIFRYHYATTETRTVTTTDANGNTSTRMETYEQDHWRNYFVAELNCAFPSLMLRGETWGDKIAGMVGFGDINFESEQFSSRYFCKSPNREFAYAVIHPQMMEWMLTFKFNGSFDKGKFIADHSAEKFDAAMCESAWKTAAGFINRIPPFVWQDYGKCAKIELPDKAA